MIWSMIIIKLHPIDRYHWSDQCWFAARAEGGARAQEGGGAQAVGGGRTRKEGQKGLPDAGAEEEAARECFGGDFTLTQKTKNTHILSKIRIRDS